MRNKALVLGLGNVLLGDDGAGVRLVERLRAGPYGEAACFVDGGTLSFGLLSHVEAAACLLAIDAADLGAAPGAVSVLEDGALDDFLSGTRRRTVHEVALADVLDMARLRGCLPPRRALLCIQPARIGIEWGATLSAAVAAALPQAERQILALLERWRRHK